MSGDGDSLWVVLHCCLCWAGAVSGSRDAELLCALTTPRMSRGNLKECAEQMAVTEALALEIRLRTCRNGVYPACSVHNV
jgi:hypothetical protein